MCQTPRQLTSVAKLSADLLAEFGEVVPYGFHSRARRDGRLQLWIREVNGRHFYLREDLPAIAQALGVSRERDSIIAA